MTREEALRVLGLKSDATPSEVQVAYRELAQMLHPDKFGDNKRLRERAEQQMRTINEARDVLMKGSRASSGAARPGRGSKTSRRRDMTPSEIAFEAEARAHAAETARLTVVAQLRTMRERRRSMAVMAAVAAVVAIVFSRMRGGIGMVVASVATMLVVWGLVDVVSMSSQVSALQKRSRDLLQARDAARKIAEEARKL